MIRFAYFVLVLAAGASALSFLPAARTAEGAVGADDMPQLAGVSVAATVSGTADVELRFIQEDGPESGHVRVVLTPQSRPLTVWEARSAAQQGFLEALNEEALEDDLRRITVVVRLVPPSHPDPAGAEEVVRFIHKGGGDWSVLAGE